LSEHVYQLWNRILEKDLQDRHLYKIRARNAHHGVYNQSLRSFTIARFKGKSWYLFDEYDWATGPPYGTAVPYQDMGRMYECV
jgi:hypothetical protein